MAVRHAEPVFAVGGQLSRLEVDVEDSVSMLLHCQQKAGLYRFTSIWTTCNVHRSGYAKLSAMPVRCATITMLTLELHDVSEKTAEVRRFDDFDRNQMFVDELNHFLACLRGECQPLINLREATRSIKISLAAAGSISSGQAEPIQW